MKAKSKYLFWIVIGIALSLWAVYVWPTPWNHYKRGSNNLRVNRFTGKTQVLSDYGWADAKAPGGSGELWQQAFPSPTLEQQLIIAKVSQGIRYRMYPNALAALTQLSGDASLTGAQKKAVNDKIEQVKQEISKAANPPQ